MRSILLSLTLSVAMAACAQAQDDSTSSVSSVSSAEEITALRQELKEQRELIRQQQRALEALDIRLEQVAASRTEGAEAQPPSIGMVASSSPMIPTGLAVTQALPASLESGAGLSPVVNSTPAGQEAVGGESKPSPLFFRIGSMDFTPGGFLDFTSIFRSTNVGSGIGTSFGSIPFPNTVAGNLTESRFSAQNARLSLKVDGTFGKNNITGYIETDFGGFLPTNAFVTSNSDSMRLRLYWLDLRRNKWEFLGGESWSFMNPNRNGLSPMPGDIFFSQNMDTNYQVGLTWTRAAQFRAIYHPNEEWAFGIALENPEQYIGSSVVLPAALASSYSGQLNNGNLTSTPNLHPDIIPKITFDKDLGGKHMHLELVGLLRSFKVFNPLTNSSTTVTGGGGSFNANLELIKNFRVILNTFYSDGGGRYIFGLGPDLIIRPDGTPSLARSDSGIVGAEWQASPKTLLSTYYGGTYFQRNFAVDPASGDFVGFGFPGSSANRTNQEATIGITQTLWKNPNYGGLQIISQYSYVKRSLWAVPIGNPANAHTNLFYVDLRYLLP